MLSVVWLPLFSILLLRYIHIAVYIGSLVLFISAMFC